MTNCSLEVSLFSNSSDNTKNMKGGRLTTRPTVTRTDLAFGVVGFVVDFFFTININASQDILKGTTIPSSAVLLAASAPACVSALVYTFLSQYIPLFLACLAIFISAVAGMLLNSLGHEPGVKLIGVCLTSFGFGSGEAVFCGLTSFHGEMAIKTYALGSGLSFLVAPLSYVGKVTNYFNSFK